MEVILQNLKDLLIFGAFLGILVIVHEWGHFQTAKKLGIKVERFSIGFGPKVFSKIHKGTEYMIGLIPFGGYVKLAGDERSECKGLKEEFLSQPPGHRALVVVNGPVVNYLLAYVCLVILFLIGYPGISTKINVLESGGPAYQAGLRVGDEIVSIDTKKVYGWKSMERVLREDLHENLNVQYLRNGRTMSVVVHPHLVNRPDDLGEQKPFEDLGIGLYSNKIGWVNEDYPAGKAGLQVGDRIIEINGQSIKDWEDLQQQISQSTTPQIEVKILRGKKEIIKEIKPEIDTVELKSGEKKEVRKIGIGPDLEFEQYRFGFFTSIRYAYEELAYITWLTYRAFYRMMTGAMSARESLSGPVGIYFIVKGAAEAGFNHLIYILALISASLAIINLFPVIPLDGGHLFFIGLERLRRKPLSPKAEEFISRLGFALIILLIAFIFYVDFSRFSWFDHVILWFKNLFVHQ